VADRDIPRNVCYQALLPTELIALIGRGHMLVGVGVGDAASRFDPDGGLIVVELEYASAHGRSVPSRHEGAYIGTASLTTPRMRSAGRMARQMRHGVVAGLKRLDLPFATMLARAARLAAHAK
jgi:hypothetical protein